MRRLTRDGTAEPVSRDQILWHEHGQGNTSIIFPCSADHEQDWQPYPVDPYSAIVCDTVRPIRRGEDDGYDVASNGSILCFRHGSTVVQFFIAAEHNFTFPVPAPTLPPREISDEICGKTCVQRYPPPPPPPLSASIRSPPHVFPLFG